MHEADGGRRGDDGGHNKNRGRVSRKSENEKEVERGRLNRWEEEIEDRKVTMREGIY